MDTLPLLAALAGALSGAALAWTLLRARSAAEHATLAERTRSAGRKSCAPW